jgi:IS5 family transposase
VPTALVEWRKRIGQSGLEMMLQETLAVAWELGFLKVKEFKEVTVDTTVQEKNIAFPTDAKLLNKSRDRLVKEAKKAGLELRQNFNRVGKHEFAKYSRYAQARQFKRAR